MRRILWIAILGLSTSALAQDSLNISRLWQSEPGGAVRRLERVGNMLFASAGDYLKVFDISQFDRPIGLDNIDCGNTPADLAVIENYVFVLGDSLQVIDATSPDSLVRIAAVLDYGFRLAVNPVSFVALTVSHTSLRVYDIADPDEPQIAAILLIEGSNRSDVAAFGEAAYVLTRTELQIYDLSDPFRTELFSALPMQSIAASCLEVIDDTLYVLMDGTIHVYELTFPLQPVEIGEGLVDLSQRSNRLTKSDTMLTMAGADNQYCFASIADMENPVAYAPFQPGNWPRDAVVQGRQALFGVQRDDFILIDFSNPENPVVLDTITHSQGTVAHAIVNDVVIASHNGNSALWTADIANLQDVHEISRRFSEKGYRELAHSGTTLAAARDSTGGFDLYDVQAPGHPVYMSTVPFDGHEPTWNTYFNDIAMFSDFVYAAFDSLEIYNAENPANPVLIHRGLVGSPKDLVVAGSRLYVLNPYDVRVFSLDDPTAPEYIGGYSYGGTREYRQIAVGGTNLYLEGSGYVQGVDMSEPMTPMEISGYGHLANVNCMAAENNIVALGGSDGIDLIDFSDPLNPVAVAHHYDWATQISLDGNILYNSDYFTFAVYDISAALPLRDQTRVEIPTKVSLSAYPNPFNPSTTITFDLNARAQVSLDVYDVTGRLVRTLINEHLNVGSYTHHFDAQGLPSGAYFARLVTPQVSQTARITLIR